jgi:N-acetylglucosamine-6-phosphate deacetylase
MASLYPAEYLYQNQKVVRGELNRGKQADMLILNSDLSVKETWISGRKI